MSDTPWSSTSRIYDNATKTPPRITNAPSPHLLCCGLRRELGGGSRLSNTKRSLSRHYRTHGQRLDEAAEFVGILDEITGERRAFVGKVPMWAIQSRHVNSWRCGMPSMRWAHFTSRLASYSAPRCLARPATLFGYLSSDSRIAVSISPKTFASPGLRPPSKSALISEKGPETFSKASRPH